MTRLSVTSKKTSSLNVTSAANSNSAIRPSPSASKRAAAAKKALTNTAKGGISKNTPPVSVLTGKTRKSSRLTSSTAPIAEKKKTVKKKFEPKPSTKESALPISTARSSGTTLSAKEKTTKEQVAKEKIMNSKPLKERLSEDKPVTEEPAVEEPTTMEPVTEELVTEELVIEEPVMQEQAKELQTSSPQQTDNQEQEKENELPAEELPLTKAEESGITERIEKNQVMYCISSDVTTQEESIAASHQEEKEVNPQHSISHVSTGSSVATADEHDAEVAATTIRARVQQKQQELPHIQSGRSSFSPNSVVSLPRPETPEVDQLRLRFENIIQTSTPSSVDIVRRRSSPKIAPEIAYRIKDMKPRGPVGSRVKSMVELFMDENLNKWEF
ncbi:hypothetical protein A0J61_06450 [Choanephora cucurbitarum]|uniref:Uncharacterized protein n=1 Tax=Choanephora cucurbitarum TaxID=101091 RepID=A0A1C7NA58_9FUNG|nr:hypothetical protein A0J61_06450 [Choanephora cucurbitarum]